MKNTEYSLKTETMWISIDRKKMTRETYLSLRKVLIDYSIEYSYYITKSSYSYIRIKIREMSYTQLRHILNEFTYRNQSAIFVLKNKPSNVSDSNIIEHFVKELRLL